MIGEDRENGTGVFQMTFFLESKLTGGFSVEAIPVPFGPRNLGQSAAWREPETTSKTVMGSTLGIIRYAYD